MASAAGTTPPSSSGCLIALCMSDAQSFGLNSSTSSSSTSLAATSTSLPLPRAPRPPRPPLPPAPAAPRPPRPPRPPLPPPDLALPAAAAAAPRSPASTSAGAQSAGCSPRPPPDAPTPGRTPRPPRPPPLPPAGLPRGAAFAPGPTMSARLPAHPRCRPLRSGFMTTRLRGLPFLDGPSKSPSSMPARFITKPSSSPIVPGQRPRRCARRSAAR